MGAKEADALGRIAVAERDLEQHDRDAELVCLLRSAVRRTSLDPDVRADLLEAACAWLAKRG